MIRSFRSSAAEKLFMREYVARFANIETTAVRRLVALHGASSLRDLMIPPNNRLEPLRGDRSGQHSIRINDQYRICFRWHEGNAYDVEIVDYH
jgi:proteic killer suppression protein